MHSITIYTAGEIHSDWRDRFEGALKAAGVTATLVGPNADHDRSDSVGEDILGEQPSPRYRDLMGARVNTLRTRVLFRWADLVVAYFGDKYRQWNTATDAGAPLRTIRPLTCCA